MAPSVLEVEIFAMFDTFEGPTLFPGDGRLGKLLDAISIHPEQEVEGMVKFPM